MVIGLFFIYIKIHNRVKYCFTIQYDIMSSIIVYYNIILKSFYISTYFTVNKSNQSISFHSSSEYLLVYYTHMYTKSSIIQFSSILLESKQPIITLNTRNTKKQYDSLSNFIISRKVYPLSIKWNIDWKSYFENVCNSLLEFNNPLHLIIYWIFFLSLCVCVYVCFI